MTLKHSQNKGAPHFPHDYPDCPAGARFQEEQEAELLDKFRRSAKHQFRIQLLFIFLLSETRQEAFSAGTPRAARSFCVAYYMILAS